MPQLIIKVQNKIAKPLNDFIVCGNSDYTIKFCFDTEWENQPIKTARFIWNNQYQDVVFEGDTCPMPVIENATTLGVGVYAGSLSTTTPAIINCTKSVLCGLGCPSDPPEDVYNQIIEILNEGITALSKDIKNIEHKYDDDIEELQNQHENDISAVNAEINTKTNSLQGQIDNLIIATGGDSSAEVIEARTDIYGTTHALLKNRLDNMENNTKEIVDNISELGDLNLDWQAGYYIDSDGNVTSNTNQGWKTTSLPVKQGEIYYIWSYTFLAGRTLAMKDTSGTVVEVMEAGTNFGVKYIVPCDGTLYICGYENVRVKGTTIPSDLPEKVDSYGDILGLNGYDWEVGKYYDSDGNPQTAAQCSYMTVDVMKGEKLKMTVGSSMSVYPLFLKDSTGIIDSLPQGNYNDYVYEVPANGRLLISTFTSPRAYVRKYVDSDFTDKVDYLEQITNTKSVVCFGDSLTQGNQDSTGNTYPKYLATLLANQCGVFNRGSGGDSSREVASRQGGMGLYVSPFTIPAATTAVEIFLSGAYGNNTYFFPGRQNISTLSTVYINGIKGKITYSGSASSLSGEHHYYFTRSEAGDAVEITRPTLVKTDGYDSRYYIQIIWAGTNDKPTLEKLKESTIPTIDNMIKFLHSDRYLVVGLTSKNYMSEIADVNDYMKQYYGNKFVNLRDYILEYGLEDAGITPTTQDLTDIENGEMPSSLRYDSVHFNAKGYKIVAERIYEQGKMLGYWN